MYKQITAGVLAIVIGISAVAIGSTHSMTISQQAMLSNMTVNPAIGLEF